MKCTIHIGLHKTGSTSIQTNCTHFRVQLLQQGIAYPSTYNMWNSHAPLAWSMGVEHPCNTENFQFDDIVNSYLEEAEGQSLVLSSEDFEFCTKDKIDILIGRLAQKYQNIEVICYLRSPISYIESDYKWHIDDPDSPHRKKSPAEFLSDIHLSERLDYHGILQNWAKNGVPKINARCFSRNTLIGGDVVSDFFEQIGFLAFPLKRAENASLTNLGAKISQLLNVSHNVDRDFRRRLDEEIRKLTDRDSRLFNSSSAKLIMQACEGSLQRLLKEFDVWGGGYLNMHSEAVDPLTPDEEFAIAARALYMALTDPGHSSGHK